MRGTADMLVGLSRAAWHRNDLDAAAGFLRRADELGEPAGLPQHPYRWRVALARLRTADRDYAGALELLDEAERVYVGDFSPQVHPIHATRARVLLASGDVAGAAAWARQHGLSAEDELSYLREYEHLTLARVLLAEQRVTEAIGLLERLLAAAEAGGRLGTVIEIEVVRSRAHSAAGEPAVALAALEHAVDLGEADGWVRYVVDAGSALTPVLQALAGSRPGSAFVQRLLAESEPRGIAAVTHQKLADDVGSVREVVSRILAQWAEAGLIELRRGAVEIVDRASLAAAGRR